MPQTQYTNPFQFQFPQMPQIPQMPGLPVKRPSAANAMMRRQTTGGAPIGGGNVGSPWGSGDLWDTYNQYKHGQGYGGGGAGTNYPLGTMTSPGGTPIRPTGNMTAGMQRGIGGGGPITMPIGDGQPTYSTMTAGGYQPQPGGAPGGVGYNQVMSPWNNQPQTNMPGLDAQRNAQAWNYTANLPTGFTPEMQELMRNRMITGMEPAYEGQEERLKEQMAGSGLGGSGAEAALLAQGGENRLANINKALTELDIQNAQTDLANRMQKSGQMGGLATNLGNLGLGYGRLGEEARQFNIGTDVGQFQAGRQFDYQRFQDMMDYIMYQQQLQQMMQSMGGYY